MRTKLTIAVALCTGFMSCVSFAESADSLYRQGIEYLRQVQAGDNAKVVQAARVLAKAVVLYEKQGDEDGAVKANACLYWCKKRMTLADASAFSRLEKNQGVAQKLEAVAKAPPKEQAQAYFDRAEQYTRANPDDHLLIAIRYFEVADRFAGTSVSILAQRRSLEAMQRIRSDSSPSKQERELPPDISSHPSVTKSWAAFGSAHARIKDDYAKRLKSALKFEMSKGNLEESTVLKDELERLETDEPTPRSVKSKNRSALYGQRKYNTALGRAQQKLLSDLTSAFKSELRKGRVESSRAIKAYKDKVEASINCERVIGMWRFTWDQRPNKTPQLYSLKPDGSFQMKWKSGEPVEPGWQSGTWTLRKNVLIIAWANGHELVITLNVSLGRSVKIETNGKLKTTRFTKIR